MRTQGSELTAGAPRLARGATAGLSTGLLAVIAHGTAGGALPDWPVTAGPVVAIALLATGLARVRLRPSVLLALLALGQLAVHVVLSLAAGHALHTGDAGGLPMTAAHALATLVVFAGLSGAEQTLFALFYALAARLPLPIAPLTVTGPWAAPCPADPPPRAPLDVLRRRVHGRRGPP